MKHHTFDEVQAKAYKLNNFINHFFNVASQNISLKTFRLKQ